jgi:hypothetical protein
VATWEEFESRAPDLAESAHGRWPGIAALDRGDESLPSPVFEVAYLATIRPDGRPRLHPFCPVLAGGRHFAAIPPQSPKGHDLRRDPRCAIHALPGPDDDELMVLALAHEVGDTDTRTMVRTVVERSLVSGMIATVADHPLFEFDIEQVDVARWVDVGRRGTAAVRLRWRADESDQPT